MTSGKAWTVLTASVRGAAHVRALKPNQDSVGSWEGGDGTVVLAVADGHGGEAYCRSDLGAEFAVEAAIGACRDLADRLAPMAVRDGMARGRLGQELAREIVRRWQRRVEEDRDGGETAAGVTLRRRPAPPGPATAYGTTLIAALALGPELVLLLQCGDGDVLAVSADGRVERPLPADERSFGNETASLCLPEAWTEFRARLLGADELPALLLLATDGYANSYAGEEAFRQVGRDLYRAVTEEGADAVDRSLPRWLRETSAGGSGDDISVGLLVRGEA